MVQASSAVESTFLKCAPVLQVRSCPGRAKSIVGNLSINIDISGAGLDHRVAFLRGPGVCASEHFRFAFRLYATVVTRCQRSSEIPPLVLLKLPPQLKSCPVGKHERGHPHLATPYRTSTSFKEEHQEPDRPSSYEGWPFGDASTLLVPTLAVDVPDLYQARSLCELSRRP